MAKNVTGADIFSGMFKNIPKYEADSNPGGDSVGKTGSADAPLHNEHVGDADGTIRNTTTMIRNRLHPFRHHPFRVNEDDSMRELAESIRIYGIKEPILIRPDKEKKGEYEIISGHRRNYAAGMAGLTEVPVSIEDMDDDAAAVIMVDSNLKRESLLPSEKAWAYRIKAEAQKRQGKRNDLPEDAEEGNIVDGMQGISEESGKSVRTVQRYIRLTFLSKDLLELVDEGKLPAGSGYIISFFEKEEQECLLSYYQNKNVLPNAAQLEELAEYRKSCRMDAAILEEVVTRKRMPKPEKRMLTLKAGRLGKYFPEDTTKEEMEMIIFELLEKWAAVEHDSRKQRTDKQEANMSEEEK